MSRGPSLRAFDRQARDFIDKLIERGWTGRVTNKGTFFAKAPDGVTFVDVPKSFDKPNRAKQNCEATFERWQKANPMIEEPTVPKPVDDPFTTVLTPVAPPEPTVVSEHPWLARKQPSPDGGKVYESASAIEVKWSDGTVSYRCSQSCGYESSNPRSVATHYGVAHTRTGEAPAAAEAAKRVLPGVDYTTHVREPYKPSERLLEALAAWLADHSWDNVDELAAIVLQWTHERPDLDREPKGPMSDAEILQRIRTLVAGPLARQIQEQTEQIATLTAEVEAKDALLSRVQEDLDALRSIMNDIGRVAS